MEHALGSNLIVEKKFIFFGVVGHQISCLVLHMSWVRIPSCRTGLKTGEYTCCNCTYCFPGTQQLILTKNDDPYKMCSKEQSALIPVNHVGLNYACSSRYKTPSS
jgi:hypothetical protein